MASAASKRSCGTQSKAFERSVNNPPTVFRSSRTEVFCKKGVLKGVQTLAQVFSCEFYEISKSTFFYRTPPAAASVFYCLSVLFILPEALTRHVAHCNSFDILI